MKFAVVCVFLLTIHIKNLAHAGELEDRKRIDVEVAQLFQSKNFTKLNQLAQTYRENENRTSSGLWKLTIFYSGIGMATKAKAEDIQRWAKIENTGLEWITHYPDIPAPYLVQANTLINHGWAYRGSDWAYKVKKESWPKFYRYLRQARTLLMKHKEIASTDPRWYELMIIIARAEQWDKDKFDKLIEEALSRFPYFYQIYFAAIDYLLPKWHGNAHEIEKFANMAVEKTRSREQTGMYTRIYWYASQSQYGAELFTKSAVVWKKMRRGMSDVLEKYPAQWNIQNFGFYSCNAGDRAFTKELINRVDGTFIRKAWRTEKYYNDCKRWANS